MQTRSNFEFAKAQLAHACRPALWLAALFLVTLIFVFPPTAVRAQVATPTVDPTAQEGFTHNPGVLIWSAPSRLHFSYFNGRDVPISPPGANVLVEGTSGGLALVGQYLALGLEGRKTYIEQPGSNLTVQDTTAALGLNLGDWIGVGLSRVRRTDLAKNQAAGTMFGLSAKLSDSFFVGGANITEQLHRQGVGDTERNRVNVGAAFRIVSKGTVLRMEYLRRLAGEAVYPNLTEDKQDVAAFHVEVLNGRLLMGMRYQDRHVLHQTAGQDIMEIAWRYTLGWVPMGGMATVLNMENLRWRDQNANARKDNVRQQIGLAYQF